MSQRSRVISRPSLHYTASLPLLKSWLDGPQQSCGATPTRPLPPILKGELRCGPTRGVLFNYVKADARLKKADTPRPPSQSQILLMLLEHISKARTPLTHKNYGAKTQPDNPM